MDKKFQDFEYAIKGKHSFRFTPKYQESFSVRLKSRIFVEIAIKTIEALDWDLVYQDDKQLEAKRKGDFRSWSHGITIKIDTFGNVEVKSVSLGNEMWDMGSNSKRVKLFIYAFNETLKTFDESQLSEIEMEIEKKDNYDDYKIPESLPSPKKYSKPNIFIPIIGISLMSVLIAYIIALLSLEGLYVIGLFEIAVGFILGISFMFLMKLGNYTDWKKINYILIVSIILVYMLNQYFQYKLILSRNNYAPIGLLAFMKLKLECGLILKSTNVGSIGLIISWIVQLGLTYLIGYMRTMSALLKIKIKRVPIEVVDFVMYHSLQGKKEISLRQELSNMGWKTELEQNMVFEAIDAIYTGLQLNRNV